MAQILVNMKNNTHTDAEKDRRGCYKRGMPVVVMPDNHRWGVNEGLPNFVVIKIPGVSVERVRKYIAPELNPLVIDNNGYPTSYRRRLWKFRLDDMPTAARNKLASTGELIIKVGTYNGDYDYTWVQVRNFLRNLQTNTDEVETL